MPTVKQKSMMSAAYKHIRIAPSGYLTQELFARPFEDEHLSALNNSPYMNNNPSPKNNNIAHICQHLNDMVGNNYSTKVEELMPILNYQPRFWVLYVKKILGWVLNVSVVHRLCARHWPYRSTDRVFWIECTKSLGSNRITRSSLHMAPSWLLEKRLTQNSRQAETTHTSKSVNRMLYLIPTSFSNTLFTKLKMIRMAKKFWRQSFAPTVKGTIWNISSVKTPQLRSLISSISC